MRKLITVVCLLFSLCLLGEQNEEIKAFTHSLSSEQKNLLRDFFRTLIKDFFSGYVLFGDKPMCIEACCLEMDALSRIDKEGALIVEGMEHWKKLNVFPDNKEYLILIFDMNEYGYRHFVCINRKAFFQVVNENLSLFRYVLGPTLTAENLLNQLIGAKERFYDVLKNDNVLLGILLGYGKQNALLVSRKEELSDAFAVQHKEEFPFLSKKAQMKLVELPKKQQKRPSLGFATIEEEIKGIKNSTALSRKLKPFDICQIPHFGCEANSEETKKLLETYEKNHWEIIKALKSESFLEDVLLKLFRTTSQNLEIPSVVRLSAKLRLRRFSGLFWPIFDSKFRGNIRNLILPLSFESKIGSKEPKNRQKLNSQTVSKEANVLFLAEDQEAIVHELVRLIHKEIREEKYFKESFLTAFLEGARASKRGKLNVSTIKELLKRECELYPLERALECHENLTKANRYFDKLSARKGWISIVSQKVYYKMLLEGEGAPLSSHAKQITFHYSFHFLGQKKVHAGTIEEESMEYFISGISHALVGMKRGEKRKLLIHPEYAYGENTYFPPNVAIAATIELIDFEEGDHEVVFAVPYKLEERNHQELVAKCEKLKKEKFYTYGVDTWNRIKSQYANSIDFEMFQRCFNEQVGHKNGSID